MSIVLPRQFPRKHVLVRTLAPPLQSAEHCVNVDHPLQTGHCCRVIRDSCRTTVIDQLLKRRDLFFEENWEISRKLFI